MTYGLMADLHLHAWDAFAETDSEGMNTRLAGLLSEIERCADAVKGSGGDTIYVAGDVFHHRGSVAPTVLNSARDTLHAIHRDTGVRFVIIPGNHDLEGKESTRLASAVTGLEGPGVEIENDVAVRGRVAMVPWFESIEQLKNRLQSLSDELRPHTADTDLLIHAPVDGVIEGLPAHGLNHEFLADLGFKRVFAGHYHNHKVFPGGVYSIGALAHHTWSDVGTRAGFLLVTDTQVLHQWSHLPQFVDLTELDIQSEEDVMAAVDGNYVRLRIEVDKVADVEEARADMLKLGAKAVLVQSTPKATAVVARAGATVKAGSSLEVSVTDFVKGREATDFTDIADDVAAEALSVLGSVNTI